MATDASQPESDAPEPMHRLRTLVRQSPALRAAAIWVLGRAPVMRRAVQRRLSARADAEYRDWVARHDTLTPADRAAIAARVVALPRLTISVVMPVFNPREDWLRAAIASVRAQLWPHWELCIADDASTAPHVARVLAFVQVRGALAQLSGRHGAVKKHMRHCLGQRALNLTLASRLCAAAPQRRARRHSRRLHAPQVLRELALELRV